MLLDVLILLFLLFVLLPFLRGIRNPRQWLGYGVEFSAVEFDERVFVRIDLENSRGKGESPGTPISISLAFGSGPVGQEASEVLPGDDERIRSFRTSLSVKPGAETISVVLRAGDSSFEMSAKIE